MIRFTNVTKSYGRGGTALADVSLFIAKGEFVFFTGASGAGKSTLLRHVYMDERPTSGEVRVGGYRSVEVSRRDVARLRRKLGIVFQDFRLLEDRTAEANVAFALQVIGTPRSAIRARVARALHQVGLSTKGTSMPGELSGGERQRVAVGRALVRRPRIYLFDEPLSSLDAQLRQELREELARLHRLTRTTSIYVTHDQKEALSLGDRVAVMRSGQVRQIGPPQTIYLDPRDLFVARFVGEPPINLVAGAVVNGGAGSPAFETSGWRLSLFREGSEGRRPRPGRALLGLRPESVSLAGGDMPARVVRVEHLGGESLLHVSGDWGTMVVRIPPSESAPAAGSDLMLHPDPARAVLFDPDSGERLL